MVCACLTRRFRVLFRAPSTDFNILFVPEVLHRQLFLTIKKRIALSLDPQNTLPIDAHSSELRLTAQAQRQTPDEPSYEVTALLLVNCSGGALRRSDNPGRAPVNQRRPF